VQLSTTRDVSSIPGVHSHSSREKPSFLLSVDTNIVSKSATTTSDSSFNTRVELSDVNTHAASKLKVERLSQEFVVVSV
jgi:hypothetical protein